MAPHAQKRSGGPRAPLQECAHIDSQKRAHAHIHTHTICGSDRNDDTRLPSRLHTAAAVQVAPPDGYHTLYAMRKAVLTARTSLFRG